MIIGQLTSEGLMGIKELCIHHALLTYRKRKDTDTEPHIVNMTINGQPIDHWYYRSRQWIDQPYLLGPLGVEPYVGQVDQAPLSYREQNYETERLFDIHDETLLAILIDQASCHSLEYNFSGLLDSMRQSS